jgi:8-hydroxy-5-deazaflavin:NADPH oxidoreductase
MRLGVIGGAGKAGLGLCLRWAKAGHQVTMGSRDAGRARALAAELSATHGLSLAGADNEQACREAELVVLSVPYEAQRETLGQLAGALAGKLLLVLTVPLVPPRVREVHLPPGGSAAQEAAAQLGAAARVVAALHHVSAAHLADLGHAIDCDVLLCGDDAAAKREAGALIEQLGTRALDAGPLCNAVALESLTPVLLYLNRHYKGAGAGIRITGLQGK